MIAYAAKQNACSLFITAVSHFAGYKKRPAGIPVRMRIQLYRRFHMIGLTHIIIVLVIRYAKQRDRGRIATVRCLFLQLNRRIAFYPVDIYIVLRYHDNIIYPVRGRQLPGQMIHLGKALPKNIQIQRIDGVQLFRIRIRYIRQCRTAFVRIDIILVCSFIYIYKIIQCRRVLLVIPGRGNRDRKIIFTTLKK